MNTVIQLTEAGDPEYVMEYADCYVQYDYGPQPCWREIARVKNRHELPLIEDVMFDYGLVDEDETQFRVCKVHTTTLAPQGAVFLREVLRRARKEVPLATATPKVGMIKEVRQLLGMGLKEAKEFVELYTDDPTFRDEITEAPHVDA